MQFYSVLVEESKIICSCRRFIQGGYFKKKQFVHRWHQKSGFNLSTLRNRLQHLLLLKFHHTLNIFISFFCGPGALLLRFSLRGQYIPFISVIHPFEFFKKRQFFHGWDQTVGFNLSTLRNSFQRLLLLKFHHALNIFIKLLFSALVHFYSVLLEESNIYCSSQQFILRQILKRSNFFTDETEKLVLTCLRLETDSNSYCFWSFTIHSISSSVFFAALVHFCSVSL